LADDERRDFQTQLVADHYSEPIGVTALGSKGRLILEPSSRGSQLTAIPGHPLTVEGVIRNSSASSHSVQLVLTNPKEPNNQPVSQDIKLKEHSTVPFSLSWNSINPPPKALKVVIKEGEKELSTYSWNIFSGKSPSTNKSPIDYPQATEANASDLSGVRVASSSERDNIVILQPPRFKEGWFGRSLVICWLYYGNGDPQFEVRERVGGSVLINRTGEEENPWRKLGSYLKPLRIGTNGRWETVLPFPTPGTHEYMVTTASSGEKLVAQQAIQISWKMFLWPYLRIVLLIAVALVVIKVIRDRI